jgi:hypothetical protein
MWESSMMFNVSPKDDFPSFRMPLSPVVPGFNIDENGLPRKTPAGAETILADELRNRCIDRCTGLILLAPGRRPSFSWDQCLAHCEGRSYFREVQPFIQYPSRAN